MLHRMRFDQLDQVWREDVFFVIKPPNWNILSEDVLIPMAWRERLHHTTQYIREEESPFWPTESGLP